MSMSEYSSADSWDGIQFFSNLEFPIDTAAVIGAIGSGVVLERPAFYSAASPLITFSAVAEPQAK